VFDHVTIRAGDRAASERFYDTVLATLGIRREDSARVGFAGAWDPEGNIVELVRR
jgi:catechol 2,3-dioxygenase-like lactoylglutathione lyase family enzyme